ncbi:MAG: heat-inducible transcriptional repressor HrcA [Rhodoluna sp.]|nr:heat-inducible transcriptional repressor HrcA [Rhodoluna sp.]
MIPERSVEVLRAIVQDYISTSQPVGSKALVDRHGFSVSAATIRNDMALLEEEELIVQTHTSSGRIPTDKGYRLFVDRLDQVKPLTEAERQAMEGFLSGSADLDEILGRTVRALSQATKQVAMVQYPTLGKSRVRNIEIVPLADTRVLLILVADTGRHEEHVLELGVAVDGAFMAELRSKLNTALAGAKLSEVDSKLNDFIKGFSPKRAGEVQVILDGLYEQIDANRTEKMLLAGTAFLAKSEGDFQRNISPLLEAIEEQVVLLKLFSELEADANGVALSIGRENPFEGLSETSVVVSGYENQGSEVAKVGVIGPTRMDYSANISAVRAIARYLTKALGA